MSEESSTVKIGSGSKSEYMPEGDRPTVPLIDRVVDGRYRIVKPLSTGGMGTVFLGKQLNVDRNVAIKLITSNAPGLETRFQREAQALAAVSHPAIVEIHDFISAETEGQFFLVMAYIDGIDLEEFLSLQPSGKLKPSEVLSLIIPVASAMVELHKSGIIHRDIKPSNIVRFLRADKRAGVKLVDFGIARREVDPNLTAEGIIMGTPPYLAPEVMLGKKHSKASDVYALAATMFELLVGTAPFGKNELHEIMKRTVHDPLVLPDSLEGEPMGQFLSDLLVKNPNNRPSAMEVLHRLERLPPGRQGGPATITIDAITSPSPPRGVETVASTQTALAEGGVPVEITAGRASDRIIRGLEPRKPRSRVGMALLFALAGLLVGGLVGGLVPYLLRLDGPPKSAAPKGQSGPTAAVMVSDAGTKAPPPRVDATLAMSPPPRPEAMRPPPMPDAAVAKDMTPPAEPKAPPSQHALIKRCKKSRNQPQLMLTQAQRMLAKQASNPESLEHARRILHVLLQGGCVKPFTQLQRQAAYTLTKLYIHKGSCYSAKNVWRMYAHRFKKAFPYRKRPPFPGCKMKK
jgi:eukaryotic-like serine/threonine-protein kinase